MQFQNDGGDTPHTHTHTHTHTMPTPESAINVCLLRSAREWSGVGKTKPERCMNERMNSNIGVG